MKRSIDFQPWVSGVLLIVIALGVLSGCGARDYAGRTWDYASKKVTLYSGGKAVREWVTSGKVHNETSSDGFYFTDADGKTIIVSGDVVIEPAR